MKQQEWSRVSRLYEWKSIHRSHSLTWIHWKQKKSYLIERERERNKDRVTTKIRGRTFSSLATFPCFHHSETRTCFDSTSCWWTVSLTEFSFIVMLDFSRCKNHKEVIHIFIKPCGETASEDEESTSWRKVSYKLVWNEKRLQVLFEWRHEKFNKFLEQTRWEWMETSVFPFSPHSIIFVWCYRSGYGVEQSLSTSF